MNENNNIMNNELLLNLLDALNKKISNKDEAMLYSKAANHAYDLHIKIAIDHLEHDRPLYALETLKKAYIEIEEILTEIEREYK